MKEVKAFRAHGAKLTQELKEEDIALTPNNEGESDEEMGAVASYWPINEERRGQIPQPATPHTPDGRRVQP